MTRDSDDVVKVYSGPPVLVEAYRAKLTEAGIACDVVGTELAGSVGSTLPAAVELWVHRADVPKAEAVINRGARPEGKPAHDRPHQHFPHPTDDPKPGAAPHRTEPYVNPDPGA
jgi:hypothetical protein